MLQIPFMALTWHKGALSRTNTKNATRAILAVTRGAVLSLNYR